MGGGVRHTPSLALSLPCWGGFGSRWTVVSGAHYPWGFGCERTASAAAAASTAASASAASASAVAAAVARVEESGLFRSWVCGCERLASAAVVGGSTVEGQHCWAHISLCCHGSSWQGGRGAARSVVLHCGPGLGWEPSAGVAVVGPQEVGIVAARKFPNQPPSASFFSFSF